MYQCQVAIAERAREIGPAHSLLRVESGPNHRSVVNDSGRPLAPPPGAGDARVPVPGLLHVADVSRLKSSLVSSLSRTIAWIVGWIDQAPAS